MDKAEENTKKSKDKPFKDFECPAEYCEECDHNRFVSWCAMALPSHEKIDEAYKIRNEGFFEGIEAAEKQYKRLLEILEEMNEDIANGKYVEVVRCGICRHHNNNYCPKVDSLTEDDFFCGWGEIDE